MAKSRYGSYFRGKYLVQGHWDIIKSPSSNKNSGPIDILDFQYGDAKGIYDLTSTEQFPMMQGSIYQLGLTQSLFTVSDQLDAWTQRTVDLSGYAGATVYVVFRYINGSQGTSWQGDLQLDNIQVGGNTYSFENNSHGFQTSTNDETAYETVTWNNLTIGNANALEWNVETGGTASTSTGRTDAADGSYFVYAETSAPATNGSYFWLRSPQVTLNGSTDLIFSEARLGGNIGQLDVFLDVIA